MRILVPLFGVVLQGQRIRLDDHASIRRASKLDHTIADGTPFTRHLLTHPVSLQVDLAFWSASLTLPFEPVFETRRVGERQVRWLANVPEWVGLEACTALRLLNDAWCSAPILVVVDRGTVVHEEVTAAYPEQAWNMRLHFPDDMAPGLIRAADTPTLKLLWALAGSAWREDNPGLDQALTAFNRSWSYRPIDAAECTAELVRGLEALFVYETEEVSYRLGLRCACLLSHDLAGRASIRAELKAAYDVRSRVVHGSPIPDTVKIQGQRVELEEFVPRLRQTARMAICSFLLLLSRFREATIKRELLDEHVLAGRGSRVSKVLGSPSARRLLTRVARVSPPTP